MKYHNRQDAGLKLAELLKIYKEQKGVIVLALPRGGVPVGYEISVCLNAPLDVYIVRKLGVPTHAELAMGAIASGGVVVLNDEVMHMLNLEDTDIEEAIFNERQELMRREQSYRGSQPFPSLKNKTVILVDDGIATGSTMKAAILGIQKQRPKAIVVAVPVAAQDTCDDIQGLVQQLICPLKPKIFNAVGQWYEDFTQITDEEVSQCLAKAIDLTSI